MNKLLIRDIDYTALANICGVNDSNLEILKELLSVEISVDNGNLEFIGSENNLEMIKKVIEALKRCSINNQYFGNREVIYLIKLAKDNKEVTIDKLYDKSITTNKLGKLIYPKTNNQLKLFDAMEHNDIVFAIGPAGTGKTYLAVAYAVSLFKKNLIDKIILTRPAVEAGENLGFLPGDLKEKIDPYLRPLYDALYDILGSEKVEKLIASSTIEIAPLAFMRGRTLENAFVILDEAQNTSSIQMKMFLTRLGFNSKMVITGDITQIDLPKNVKSGLADSVGILKGISGIESVFLDSVDVVRNPLVLKIIEAYSGK